MTRRAQTRPDATVARWDPTADGNRTGHSTAGPGSGRTAAPADEDKTFGRSRTARNSSTIEGFEQSLPLESKVQKGVPSRGRLATAAKHDLHVGGR